MFIDFYKYISKLEGLKYPKYCGLQERRQFLCFLFTTFVEMIYIPANIFGLNGYHNSLVFDVYNWVHLVFAVFLQIAFWKDMVSTRTSLYLFFISIVVKLSSESLYELFCNGLDSSHILGNFNIILILSVVAIAIRLKKLAFIIIFAYTLDLALVCSLSSPEYAIRIMRIFFIGYMLVLLIIVFDSKSSTIGLRQPREITKEEQMAIDMLINLNDTNKEKAYSLLSRLTEEEESIIFEKSKDYFLKKQVETANFLAICPTLTKSEIEICKLVMRDKSLKEICSILGKSKSNITCQRTHIRRKLGLQKHEDLKMALEEMFRMLENK